MKQVLYQNPLQTVTLLDLPQSIAEGSGVYLVSSARPTQPFPSLEPKGSKREKLLSSVPQDEQIYNKQLEELIVAATSVVRQQMGQKKWCLDGVDAIMSSQSSRCTDDLSYAVEAPVAATMTQLPLATTREAGVFIPPLILSSCENELSSFASLENTIVFNPCHSIVRLHIAGCHFQVPPCCTFLLSSIEQGVQKFAPPSAAPSGCPGSGLPEISAGEFDFILLDPPWPNRSVRNAKTYHTSALQQEKHPFHQAIPIIDRHLSRSGIAAIWITNKRAIRKLVLHSMQNLGLKLFEEWIWLKTTIYGEPVTPLDGLWRKPYELLLLFRHDLSTSEKVLSLQEYSNVKRRLVIAVPDFHSRKPCLKELLKPLLPKGYRALEIFARNLTAEWWSWGDEVLKFNEENTP